MKFFDAAFSSRKKNNIQNGVKNGELFAIFLKQFNKK